MTGKDTADWLPKWEYPGEEDYNSEVLFLSWAFIVKMCHMTGKDIDDWLPKWEYPGEEDYHSFSKQSFHWSTLYHVTGKDTADWLPKWEYPGEEDYHSEVLS